MVWGAMLGLVVVSGADQAKFEYGRGTGTRFEGRTCTFTFVKR